MAKAPRGTCERCQKGNVVLYVKGEKNVCYGCFFTEPEVEAVSVKGECFGIREPSGLLLTVPAVHRRYTTLMSDAATFRSYEEAAAYGKAQGYNHEIVALTPE